MYTQKPYAAFGHVLIKNTYAANESVEVVMSGQTDNTFFWTRGRFHSVDKATGNVLPDWEAGMFYPPEQHIAGTFIQTPPEETIIWCFDPKINKNFTPELNKFSLGNSENTTLPQGTKLFLCEGVLEIDGKQITSPTQVLVKNGDKQATAVGQCYGIIFG